MGVFCYSRASVAIRRKVRVHDIQRGHYSSSTRREGQSERNEWQEVYKVSHNGLGVAKKRMLDEKERKRVKEEADAKMSHLVLSFYTIQELLSPCRKGIPVSTRPR